MGVIVLIVIVVVFLIRNDSNGESSIDKIIETILGLGVMVIAFALGAFVLMMIVSMIASL